MAHGAETSPGPGACGHKHDGPGIRSASLRVLLRHLVETQTRVRVYYQYPSSEKEIALRQMLAELHRQVAENAEHVGKRFAEEALKIHHGESDNRAIYGEASLEDARMLHEEGVEFLPLPRLPDAGH